MRKCHSESFLITTKLPFLLNNCEVTLTTAFWKTSYRWRFYEHGPRYILIRSSRFKKISWNENQRRCLENYHSQKSTTPHLKEHCTKMDDIWLVILRFFFCIFSQTNLVFTDIFDSFCHSLFTFLPFDFWYSTYFRCPTEFIQCPYTFFHRLVKSSASKCFYYVLISMKHSFLLTTKIASDVDNSLLLVQVVYICQVTFL